MAAVSTGGCLCGAVRYESHGDPIFSLQCHCRDCQRSSGTAYIAAMRVPAAGFRITRGAPKTYVGKADSGNEITRAFCGDCGSPLYVRVATRPDIVGLRVGTLDDPGEFRPEADIFVKARSLGSTSTRPCQNTTPTRPAARTGRTTPDERPFPGDRRRRRAVRAPPHARAGGFRPRKKSAAVIAAKSECERPSRARRSFIGSIARFSRTIAN